MMIVEVDPLRTHPCALVLLALTLPASAQSLARFVPPELGASATGSLELSFVRESKRAIELQPWPVREVGWLFVRGEGTQRNFDALAPRAEDATRLGLELDGPGPHLVGWDLPPRVERMQPAELRAFLAERSPDRSAPRALQALAEGETVPVLRLESLQLLAGSPAGAAPAGPSAVALGKAGLRMELRALFDPGWAAPESDVPFRLYLPEGGRADVLARLVHLESRAALPLTLTQDGSLRARPDRPGAWLLEASRVRALDGSPAAQGATLELASITFVFVVPAAAGEQREGGR
jgi:hypothetical protein